MKTTLDSDTKIDIVSVLKKLNIDPKVSVHRAIYDIGIRVNNSSSRVQECNRIIAALGVKMPRIRNASIAEVYAKGLIEQAVINYKDFDPEQALAVAEQKYKRILELYPYALRDESVSDMKSGDAPSTTRARPGADNDKKQNALKIYKANSKLPTKEIVQLISKELGITYANASYYVTRVFKKK